MKTHDTLFETKEHIFGRCQHQGRRNGESNQEVQSFPKYHHLGSHSVGLTTSSVYQWMITSHSVSRPLSSDVPNNYIGNFIRLCSAVDSYPRVNTHGTFLCRHQLESHPTNPPMVGKSNSSLSHQQTRILTSRNKKWRLQICGPINLQGHRVPHPPDHVKEHLR